MENSLQISIPDHVQLSIELHHNCPFLKTELNGNEALFFLDSGAPSIFLNRAGVQESDLFGERQMLGSSGAFTGNFTRLRELTFGGCRFAGQIVPTIPMDHLEEGFGVSIQGIIGFRQLIHSDWMVDYGARELQLWNMANPDDFQIAERFKVQYRNHLPGLNITIGGKKYFMLVDTGASVILFDENKLAEIQHLVSDQKDLETSGAGSNTVNVQEGVLSGFQVGETEFGPAEIHLASIEALQTRLGKFDGIIGAALFSKQKTLISWMKRELWFLEG